MAYFPANSAADRAVASLCSPRSPYKGPMGVDASEGHEVAQMVGNIEQASAAGACMEFRCGVAVGASS